MSEIVLLGLSHKTAPIELRECIAFSPDQTAAALASLKNEPTVNEVLLFSTCNRVEVLLVTKQVSEAVDTTKRLIARFNRINLPEFENILYIHTGDQAVRHIFRVAASLDSMVVGEPQILGQIKQAYRLATQERTTGVVLNRLLHRAFFVAKRIRSETGIGGHAVSISYAAIELGRKIFGSLEGKKILLIGAGEMAELAVTHLIRNRAGDILVTNRTFERAVELSRRFRGRPIRFEELFASLADVDIVISSTGAPDFVVKREHLKGVLRKRRNRPLFFIDIAVPRDIDPLINRLSNTYVYDIDDLNGVIDDNIEDRQREAVKGERIVDQAVINFRKWYDSLDVVPTIKALRKKLEDIAALEVKKTLQAGGLSDEGRHAVERMTQAMINKILHDPTDVLKRNGCQGNRSAYLDITRKLFKLDE
ncbi:MAG: glutamyl-tRNA reductase [Desulfobacterales bacterium]|jgi:glutamyl-tRNA reductase